jgi:hypothetical protein
LEDFAVDLAYGFPVFSVGEVDTCADYVCEGSSSALEDGLDEGEDFAGLCGGVGFIGAYRAGARDVDGVADAHGSGEADDGFVG